MKKEWAAKLIKNEKGGWFVEVIGKGIIDLEDSIIDDLDLMQSLDQKED